jgi:hypothetical protein
LFSLAAPTIVEEPVNSGVLDKNSSPSLLATPAVRRMAKDLQVK